MGNSKTSKSGGSAPLKALQKFASLFFCKRNGHFSKRPDYQHKGQQIDDSKSARRKKYLHS
jgi:hypothetical protein